MKITVIFILRQGVFRYAKSPKIGSVFNPHKSFPRRRLDAASRKSIEIQVSSLEQQRPFRIRKFV